jgi:hypothetical protein
LPTASTPLLSPTLLAPRLPCIVCVLLMCC